MGLSILSLALSIFTSCFIVFSHHKNMSKNKLTDNENRLWIFSIVSLLLFIGIFITHSTISENNFVKILKETENFYISKPYYTNFKIEINSGNIITNMEFKTFDNDNRMNARIDLLSERIVHYQKTATDTLNWWIAILSILFVLITGVNFYSYNDSKKKLEKAVYTAERLIKKQKTELRKIKKHNKKLGKTTLSAENKINKAK